MPSTSPASPSTDSGTTTVRRPAVRAASTAGRMPRTRRTRPSRASSPSRTVPASFAPGTESPACSTAAANARSYTLPTFGSVAGDRARITRPSGHFSPEFATAARTRSRDSCNVVSGRPTRWTDGSPCPISASISTSCPSTPVTATE